jgi:hypothetical protein
VATCEILDGGSIGRSCARFSTGFLPTRSGRRGKTVLLTSREWKMASDDGVTRAELGIDEGDLQCFSGNGNGTYGNGGPRQSFCDGCVIVFD